MGIVKGSYSYFNPEQNITRGEFICLISRSIFNLTNYTPNYYFSDVKSNHMFFSEISIAKENGIIIGKQNGYLGENENITREEAVIIISRLFDKYSLSKSYSFLDISNNYTYKNELDKAVDLGIIEGKPNGKFEPYSLLKRSESAKILIKILNLYGEKDLESAVLSVANTYLNNPDANIISRAKEDEDFKKNYIRYANSLGVNVEKTINNVKMNIENLTSNIANCVATYDVTFTTTYPDGEKKIKTYDGKCILHLLRKNNEWKIYRADENFFIKDKVNLTWEVFINPPSYAPEGVNVISPTWFELTEDNSYKNSYSVYSDLSLNLYLTDKSTKKYVDYAKNNGYDLWIAYRNDFNKYNTEKFLKSNAAKEKALKLVIESVLKNKAEGINLDFENMTNKYDYARHVREVVLASHALGLLTSVDITKYEKTSLSWSMCFDRDYIGKICDYTALMAYDEYGSHSTSSGSTASLSWVEDSIKTTLNEVENRKLILGIPFYVRYWQEKNGKVIKTSAISMERANEIIKENNAKKVIKDGQYVATWQKDGFTFSIYLEDEFSVKNRVNLINKYNLSGVASWRRGFETKNIWKTINDTMQ
jgi:spore germination protein YaaH